MKKKEELQLSLRKFEIKKQKRMNIAVHVFLTFILQFTLVIMTFSELFNNCAYYEIVVTRVGVPIIFARFICATILHLSLVDEVSHGLDMMKFAVNHSYQFQHYTLAFASGLLQTVSCLGVELANIGVLCCAADTINIVFNFIALAIIAEFDNYVFYSLKNESMTLLIDEQFTKLCLVVKHTSSKKCGNNDLTDEKDADGNFRPIKIEFKARSWDNIVLFLAYKLIRIFYVSVFFYFIPFSAIMVSTLVPFLYRNYAANLPYCAALN
jgi:hypothetical protein